MSRTIKLCAIIARGNINHYSYNTLQSMCNYSKDIAKFTARSTVKESASDIGKVSVPTSLIPPDYLLQNLKNATSSQNVLEIVGAHYRIMNSKQLLQALRSLFTLQKFGNTNISTQQIIKHPDFEKLCYCLKSQAGMIELNETLEALKIITFVGVSSNSTIVQVLLQLLRHNINDLAIPHVIFLDFLLKQFKGSPLVDGLLIALPIVFEVNLPVKMDRDNITQLAECLHYASKKNVSAKCVELIVSSLIKVIDFRGELDAKIACSILWSICDMEPNEFFVPLFKMAINGLLTEGFEKLNYQDVLTTLTKICYKTNLKFLHYYDEVFYDSVAHYIIDKDLGFKDAIFTLLRFNRLGHTNDNLLNYISKKSEENPELLTAGTPIELYALVIGTAQSEYKPPHWENIKEVIESTKNFHNYKKRDVLWLKLAACLSALDIYKLDVLEKALNVSYLKHTITHGIPVDYEHFLLILQVINVFKPDLKHLLPDKPLVQSFTSKIKPIVEYPLEGALKKALGGEDYVITCMRTKLHHHIDHVIIMRKGCFPIPLTKHYQYVEDIEVPTDGFMILVLALDNWHYTINTKRLKATSLLMIKTLETLGYNVVPICMDVWDHLSDFERIPFIMQAIRLKIDTQIEISKAVC